MCQVRYAWWIVNHIITSVKMCGPPPAHGPCSVRSAESSLSWVMAFRKCTSMTHRQKKVLFIELMSFSHSHLYENRESRGFRSRSLLYLSQFLAFPLLLPFPFPEAPGFSCLTTFAGLAFFCCGNKRKKKQKTKKKPEIRWIMVIYNGILPMCRPWWSMQTGSAFSVLISGQNVWNSVKCI